MKSLQLFICDMRLNVLLKTNFRIIQCKDFRGCHAVQVQQEKFLAQMLVPHKARSLVQPHGVLSFPSAFLKLCQSVLSL